ncbi:MAG: redoxin domain-containing protein [Nocardioides sp.]|nr:redoxin domain-containing protein [Nocardioides sp.]
MTPKSNAPQSAQEKRAARAQDAVTAKATTRKRQALLRVGVALTVLIVIGVLFTIFRSANQNPEAGVSGGSGKYIYQTGKPGVGQAAIDFSLPSTRGGTAGLSDFKGKTVLTYWHEGLGCQPCWDQIRAFEDDPDVLKAAGIDEFVSITSGPVDALAQKMADDGLTSTTLADTDLAVSRQYQMNQFGMMGDSRDGHSFALIGPDGQILWRADYGGAPNYTMFVPVDTLLEQLKAGLRS